MNEIDNSIIHCFSPEDTICNLSYGAWTAKWWEWALSVPMPLSPILDDSGKYADRNQNYPVWFLAGTIGDENKIANRTCTIPKQTPILFPVINYVRTLEPRFKSDYEMVAHVREDIDDIVKKEVVIDGHAVQSYRVNSDPCLFSLSVKEENKLDIPIGTTIASADGYWVFIKSLHCGQHDLYFHGACSGGIRNASARYQITVI